MKSEFRIFHVRIFTADQKNPAVSKNTYEYKIYYPLNEYLKLIK